MTAATASSSTVTRSKSSTTDAVEVSSSRQCTRSETAWPMDVPRPAHVPVPLRLRPDEGHPLAEVGPLVGDPRHEDRRRSARATATMRPAVTRKGDSHSRSRPARHVARSRGANHTSMARGHEQERPGSLSAWPPPPPARPAATKCPRRTAEEGERRHRQGDALGVGGHQEEGAWPGEQHDARGVGDLAPRSRSRSFHRAARATTSAERASTSLALARDVAAGDAVGQRTSAG